MTEVAELKATRELDVLVAERLGWTHNCGGVGIPEHWVTPQGQTYRGLPEWSTSIAVAWELVEKLKEMGEDKSELFQITWNPSSGWWVSSERFNYGFDVNAPTAPLAIVLAFLKATEETR